MSVRISKEHAEQALTSVNYFTHFTIPISSRSVWFGFSFDFWFLSYLRKRWKESKIAILLWQLLSFCLYTICQFYSSQRSKLNETPYSMHNSLQHWLKLKSTLPNEKKISCFLTKTSFTISLVPQRSMKCNA